jgi:hypothetical protein
MPFANIAPATPVVNVYVGGPNSSGNNTLVAGITGKCLAVWSYAMLAAGSVSADIRSSGGTLMTPDWPLVSGLFISRVSAPGRWLSITQPGEGLVLHLSGAFVVSCEIQYAVVGWHRDSR